MTGFPAKEEFLAYLKKLPSDHKFETTQQTPLWSQSCPLAAWLRTLGHPDPRVALAVWYPSPTAEVTADCKLPLWAQEVVRCADSLVPRDPGSSNAITAEQLSTALALRGRL